MPRLNDLVSADRSKNRAAIRKAPTLSPEVHAERTLLILEFMRSGTQIKLQMSIPDCQSNHVHPATGAM
jgi:hypothetical protein